MDTGDEEEDAWTCNDDGDQPESPPDRGPSLHVPKVPEDVLAAWIGRVVHRDEQALVSLYDALVGKVYGLAYRITRQQQLAEEVTEDVFWQVWRQAPRFEPDRGRPSAWIMAIARSRALDALRRRPAEEVAPAEPVETDDGGESDPADLLYAVERNTRLHQALGAMEPLSRQLVALAFLRGLTHEEIASQTGLPLGTVKSTLRRALRKLQSLLWDFRRTDMVTT